MSEEFVTLKLAVISDAVAEREILNHSASQASVPLHVVEFHDTAKAGPICEWLARENPDIVMIDSRVPYAERKIVINAVRDAASNPLLLAIGRAEGRALDILTEATAVDGVVTVPINRGTLLAQLNGCVRARFVNRILIVDDSATVRSVVRKVLQASRFRLESHEAADGTIAVDRALSEHFDIVFLDCHMPGQDGFSTLQALQRIRPDIKVVMMTATSDSSIAGRAKELGADDLLYKPFYANDIDVVMNRLFGLIAPELR